MRWRLREGIVGARVTLADRTGVHRPGRVVRVGWTALAEPVVTVMLDGVTGTVWDGGVGLPAGARWLIGWEQCRAFSEVVS